MSSVVTVDRNRAPRGTAEADDREIGRRFAAGEEPALALAYDRWAGQIHGMAVRAFGPGPDAEDVTQQTFVSAWTGRAGHRPDPAPPPARAAGHRRPKIAHPRARRQPPPREAQAAL